MVPNTFKWRDWGQAAFEESKDSGKPVFLLINDFWSESSASAPAQMEADRELAALLKRAYVPVLADADKHPDVYRRYGSGPPPCGTVLHADGNVVACFPAVEPQELFTSLRAITLCTAGHRPKRVLGLGAYQVPYIPSDEGELERGLELTESIKDRIVASLDHETGGFGGPPGAGSVAPLRFLMTYATEFRDDETQDLVVKCLHTLAHSDLYDGVEGGFFHARDEGGLHTEKILSENAEWATLALQVARGSDAGFALPLAKGILHFIQSHLLLKDGAFASGQRADPSFYVLSLEERRLVSHPPVCNAGLTSASASAASALCVAWRQFGEPAYLEMAERAYAFLRANAIAPDGTTAHSFSGNPEGLGLLEDQLGLGFALLDLYHSTLEPRYLEGMKGTVSHLLSSYLNPAGNGFLDVRVRPDGKGVPYHPIADPCLNARAAEFFALASGQLEDEALAAPARRILAALMSAELPDAACLGHLGCALLRTVHPAAFYLAETDGSSAQRARVLEGILESAGPFGMIIHRVREPGEPGRALPSLSAHCGNRQRDYPLP